MPNFLKRLFRKKQRLYPVVDPKKIIYTPAKETPIESILLIVALICLALASCSPTASLPNGCKYKINAPKFNK